MGSVRKKKYSVRPYDEAKLGLQRRNMFRKGKSAIEGDPKKSWSGIETEWEVIARINNRLNVVMRYPTPFGWGQNGCWPSRGSQLPQALPAL